MYEFTYYLHDDSDSTEREEFLVGQGVPQEVAEALGRPFYEVTLNCRVNEEGKVEVVSVKL